MTKKELMIVAGSSTLKAIMERIFFIQENLCHKTVYETELAHKEIKELQNEFMSLLQEFKTSEF